MLRVDGGQGEGGGQLVRTALAVAAVHGLPVEVHAIRARRSKPGLQAQHLAAARALREICDGRLEGAELGAERVAFLPGAVRPGDYRFEVGTAGATSLVLQAVLLPLALAAGPSRVVVTGGTHVPWSPPADYLSEVLLPLLEPMGLRARLTVRRYGFFPKGGGEVALDIVGRAHLAPLTRLRGTAPLRVRGVSVVARLPRGIAERQRDQARRRLEAAGQPAEIEVRVVEAADPGSYLFLVAEADGPLGGFLALGRPGLPAEQVADEAVDEFLQFASAGAGCDPRLADQLVLPLALATGTSRLTTSRITSHLCTTLAVIQQLLGCPAQLGGEQGGPGSLTLEGTDPDGWTAPVPAAPGEAAATRETAPLGSAPPVIRKARAVDVPAMQRLLAAFATRGDVLPRTLNEMYQHLRDFFVAETGGDVVGMCGLFIYWGDLAEVRSLAVRESAGGRGLGSRLVRACLEEAGTLGVRRVFALTNRPGFFARIGFQPLDKQKLPQKIWKDCITCAKFSCCDEVALIRDIEDVQR
ncbi:MAG TPA: RNA 3'-terminal phosphate cyclase [Candidatus Sulfotelmatobacter sp.]|nr:RNA 3'-terminal phosphate cyclase [Candidatus Sulfotelmatobacter sp.]